MKPLHSILTQMGYPIDKWSDVPAKVWKELGFEQPPNFTLEALPPAPKCAACADRLWVTVATPGHPLDGQTIPCPRCEAGRALQQCSYERHLKNAGLPERYQTLTFSTFEALSDKQKANKLLAYGSAALFAIREGHWFSLGGVYDYLTTPAPKMKSDPERNSLVLYGEYGVGKTGLAAAVVNALLGQESVLYIRVQDLLRNVQKTYDRDYEGESRDAIVWRVKTSPVLILDEFGMRTISNDRSEILEEIIRYRCGRDLPFVATTNDEPALFRSKWDGRIADVMLESAHWIPMGLPSLRDQTQVDVA